jgi:multidrug transporter EmrE-like cation transporter
MLSVRFVAILVAYVCSSTTGLVLMRRELRRPDVSVLSLASLTNWRLLLAVLLYAASFGFWLLALERYPLTAAYPVFIGVGYTSVTLCAILLLHEDISLTRGFGIAMIGVGLVFVLR